jgi:aminopeptidase YwaD
VKPSFPVWVLLLGACACSDPASRITPEMLRVAPPEVPVIHSGHRGPPVVAGESGPARFVAALTAAFDQQRAMQTVRFVDGFYRAPANDGYEAVLEYLAVALREAGFGVDPRLELTFLETELTGPGAAPGERTPAPAWTPISAALALRRVGQPELVLHSFSRPEERDRVMLPINTPSADVEGTIALSLDELREGQLLVTQAAAKPSLLARAKERGAAAVVSCSLEPFNSDPSGRDRHLDAIQFRSLPAGTRLPVAQISAHSYGAICAARKADPEARLSFRAEVALAPRKLRTLVATVVGTDRPEEAVVTVSHVQEPGACDNASGVAGLLESARSFAGLLQQGKLRWPSRSVAFVWGDEFRQSIAWLEHSQRRAVAGLSSDMTGESCEKTGAIALLERQPDPGALKPIAPDVHTPWGAGEVKAEDLKPNGLAVIARSALADVGAIEGGWDTSEHPWEGGSDHDEFIRRGIPAALFWHFTDFAYHTSLDRLENVDSSELARTGVALMATALALADPLPADLARYLETNKQEMQLRVRAAEEAGDPELAQRWTDWSERARQWLRIECLRLPPSER